MPVIYFVRHGETNWNARRRIQGWTDIPLNDKGRAQAARNGAALAALLGAGAGRFDFIASPLSRARMTMEIVREALGLPSGGYRVDPRLRELNYGSWEGRRWQDIRAGEPEQAAARERDPWGFRPPGDGGESLGMLANRLASWRGELARDAVIVSHRGVSRCLRALISDPPLTDPSSLDAPQDQIMKIDGDEVSWI